MGKDKADDFSPRDIAITRINFNKCFERHSNYRLHGHTLWELGKYLGLHLSSNLSWLTNEDAIMVKRIKDTWLPEAYPE